MTLYLYAAALLVPCLLLVAALLRSAGDADRAISHFYGDDDTQ